jgi:hypothetical protein
MSMTAGPWKFAPNLDCPGDQKGAFVFIEVAGDRCVLAEVSARNVILQEICEANARAMATVPDFLAVLVECRGALRLAAEQQCEDNNGVPYGTTSAALERINWVLREAGQE